MPGTGQFVLHTPTFDRAIVELPGKASLTISARRAEDAQLHYIDETHINGTSRDEVWVGWDELRSAGTIDDQLAPRPTEWGTVPGSAPASPCAQRR